MPLSENSLDEIREACRLLRKNGFALIGSGTMQEVKKPRKLSADMFVFGSLEESRDKFVAFEEGMTLVLRDPTKEPF